MPVVFDRRGLLSGRVFLWQKRAMTRIQTPVNLAVARYPGQRHDLLQVGQPGKCLLQRHHFLQYGRNKFSHCRMDVNSA